MSYTKEEFERKIKKAAELYPEKDINKDIACKQCGGVLIRIAKRRNEPKMYYHKCLDCYGYDVYEFTVHKDKTAKPVCKKPVAGHLTKNEQLEKVKREHCENFMAKDANCPVCKGYIVLTRKTGQDEQFICVNCKSEISRPYITGKCVATRIPKELGKAEGPRQVYVSTSRYATKL